jgi:hypothetical protein
MKNGNLPGIFGLPTGTVDVLEWSSANVAPLIKEPREVVVVQIATVANPSNVVRKENILNLKTLWELSRSVQTRNDDKKLDSDGCRIESREEAGDDNTTHTSPLAVPAGPEPHILVRPPGEAGHDPSRHTTVYGCRIEGTMLLVLMQFKYSVKHCTLQVFE